MHLTPTISIILPAYNSGATIEQALMAVCGAAPDGLEIIVIDDASTDGTTAICERYPVRLLRLTRNGGPAHARNRGASLASGEVLLFLDADTTLEPGALEKIAGAFRADPELDGLIGAYDDKPAAPGTVSQFRNLLHCFVHRNARRRASTFWSGCGALKKATFLTHNGFDETYRRASIEDLEFGYRLSRAGSKILMDPEIQVKHLKRWTLGSMVETDVRDRGIPWTQLILREQFMPADLNLGIGQRWSVIGIYLAVALGATSLVVRPPWRVGAAVAALLILLAVIAVNRRFYEFLAIRRGPVFAAQAIALHLLFYFYNGLAFLIGLVLWFYGSHPFRQLRRRFSAIIAG